MNLNGGYIMIDYNKTTGMALVNTLENAYKCGKPVMLIKDDTISYCMLEKENNYYNLITNDNKIYKVFVHSGAITSEVIVAQYKHIMKFTGTFGNTERTFIAEITNRKPEAYANANSALIAITRFGHVDANSAKLVTDTNAVCGLLYVSYTTPASANYKALGTDSYASVSANSLTFTDTVIDLSTVSF